jgi:hypothetical protein
LFCPERKADQEMSNVASLVTASVMAGAVGYFVTKEVLQSWTARLQRGLLW